MKNVTVTIDDELHRKARIRAAELGTSLSALVKQYLESLTGPSDPASASTDASIVRDMMPAFRHAPVAQATDGPPWLVDGKWVYTRDGKPRQPGALRGKITMADDWDEWPDGFIEAMYGEDTEKPWFK